MIRERAAKTDIRVDPLRRSEVRLLAVLAAAAAMLHGSARAEDEDVWTLPGAVNVRREKEENGPAGGKSAGTGRAEPRTADESSLPTPATGGVETVRASATGLEMGGSLVGTVQATSGATDDTASGIGRLELDFEVAYSEGSKLFFSIESISGDGPSANCSNFSEVNANAGSTQDPDGADRMLVREAWIELSRGPVAVTFGKIDPTVLANANAFANDERTQFLSGAFTNDISLVLPRGGITPGAAIVLSPGAWTVILVGVSDDNSSDGLFEDVTSVLEVGFAYGGEGRQGNIRLHGALDGAGKDSLGGPANDVGWGLSLDQEVGRTVGFFARVGKRETDAVDTEVESSWSAGVELHGFSVSRGDDTVGLAYGEVAAPGNSIREKLFEVYYRAPLSEKAAMSGHLQVLSDALCDPAAGTITVLGMRALLEF